MKQKLMMILMVFGMSIGFGLSAAQEVAGQGKIAFVSQRDGNPEIYVMNPDGSNQMRLTKPES